MGLIFLHRLYTQMFSYFMSVCESLKIMITLDFCEFLLVNLYFFKETCTSLKLPVFSKHNGLYASCINKSIYKYHHIIKCM